MRGGAEVAADFSAMAGESVVVREAGQFTVGSTQAGRVATEVTGPSFADVSNELGLEVPGTIRYRSTAAAAAGARALETASRPGFQSHATASSVRRAFNVSGRL